MLLVMFNWGPHFSCPSQMCRLAGQAESCLKAQQAPLVLIHPKEVWPGLLSIEQKKRLGMQRRGLSLPAWRKFPPRGRIARRRLPTSSCSRLTTSVHRSRQPSLLRNSGTIHSKEPATNRDTTRVVEKMVYSATESVKKRLGSCEKVTMKLRSLLNISSISNTCASHKRLEESSEVRDREFRLVTRGEFWRNQTTLQNCQWCPCTHCADIIVVLLYYCIMGFSLHVAKPWLHFLP